MKCVMYDKGLNYMFMKVHESYKLFMEALFTNVWKMVKEQLH